MATAPAIVAPTTRSTSSSAPATWPYNVIGATPIRAATARIVTASSPASSASATAASTMSGRLTLGGRPRRGRGESRSRRATLPYAYGKTPGAPGRRARPVCVMVRADAHDAEDRPMSEAFSEIDRRDTPIGVISVWRRREPTLQIDVYEVKLGDEYLMSSLFTVAEVALADLALAALPGPTSTSSSVGSGSATPPGPAGRSPCAVRARRRGARCRDRVAPGGPDPVATVLTADPRAI